MTSINVQCNIQNGKLKNYPKVTVNSIVSKYKLVISSTGNKIAKCLFILFMLQGYILFLNELWESNLNSHPLSRLGIIVEDSIQYVVAIFMYLNYNHNFLRQIEHHWNELQINFDYETRKYFWTQMVIGRLFSIFTVIQITIYYISCVFYLLEHSLLHDVSSIEDNVIFHLVWIIFFPVVYFNTFCDFFIHIELSILAQSALQFNLIKLNKLYKESVKDNKILNIDVIQDLRQKYLSTRRLVDKINETMSLYSCSIFILFVINSCHLFYNLLYLESHRTKWTQASMSVLFLISFSKLAHSAIQVHTTSQEILMTVYKLSLKTDSIRVLNEITLFLNCNEIGFSFGGLFMFTTSSLSTLYSILMTIVIAIPSFAS
uniref:Gustatory receptor n=1 Tax=Tetranychus urticae TaxID=32264 RepID=T1KJE3_TETUR